MQNEPLKFLWRGNQSASVVSSAFLTLGQSGEPMYHLGLQLARENRWDHLHSETGDT